MGLGWRVRWRIYTTYPLLRRETAVRTLDLKNCKQNYHVLPPLLQLRVRVSKGPTAPVGLDHHNVALSVELLILRPFCCCNASGIRGRACSFLLRRAFSRTLGPLLCGGHPHLSIRDLL